MVPTPTVCSPVWRGFWCVTSHVTRTKAGLGAFIGVLSPSVSSVSQVKKRNAVLRPQGCPCPRSLTLGAPSASPVLMFPLVVCLPTYPGHLDRTTDGAPKPHPTALSQSLWPPGVLPLDISGFCVQHPLHCCLLHLHRTEGLVFTCIASAGGNMEYHC